MTIKTLCLSAMGTALFVVLTLCLQVPVFEIYYLCLGYVIMMIYCYYFSLGSSMIVGTFGVVLYCLLISGLRGMPGWVFGNLVITLAVSLSCKYTAGLKNKGIRSLIILSIMIGSTAAGILGLKSLVEMILYAQPYWLRVAKNLNAFIADIVVMAVSIPICEKLEGTIRKLFPNEIATA